MSKSKAATTLPITEKIGFLETEINNLKREIEQGEDALKLVQTPPRFAPAKGELPFFDRLNEILEQSRDEQERSLKVAAAQQAIAQSKELLAEKQSELIAATQELERVKEESIWMERYEPLVAEFQSGYVMPAEQKKEIARLGGLLASAEKLLFDMETVIDTNSSVQIKMWEQSHPGYAPLKKTIPEQKDRIANLEEQLKQARKINQEDFRRYVKEKADMDGPLQALLISQEAYTKAWQQFIQVAGNSSTLNISVEDLKKRKIPLVTCSGDQIKIEMQDLS